MMNFFNFEVPKILVLILTFKFPVSNRVSVGNKMFSGNVFQSGKSRDVHHNDDHYFMVYAGFRCSCACGCEFAGRIMLPTWLATVLISVVAGARSSAQAEVHVGNAINVFSRYGYLSISMRVVPRNDSDRSWIVREPTVEIFSNVSNANSE